MMNFYKGIGFIGAPCIDIITAINTFKQHMVLLQFVVQQPKKA